MPVTLLAVDDSVTMRKVLELTFAGEDYRVLTADSADSALTVARAERPAVVLADATLDGKTGYDLCQALKREMPNVPVLVLSSKLHPYDPAKGQAARVDDHIDKPFDTQQLIDKVRALVAAPAAAAKVPAAAPTQAARPPAPPPAGPGARPAAPAAAPGAGPRPAAPAPAAAGPRPVPHNLRQTIAYPGMSAGGPLPQAQAPGARPQPQVQPRPAAPAPQPASPPARPAPPAAAQPAPAAHPAPAHAPAAAAVAPGTAAAIGAMVEGDLGKKLAGLGLSKQQVEGVLALSHEVVERVVWEVVPILAETIIKEELKRLTAD